MINKLFKTNITLWITDFEIIAYFMQKNEMGFSMVIRWALRELMLKERDAQAVQAAFIKLQKDSKEGNNGLFN